PAIITRMEPLLVVLLLAGFLAVLTAIVWLGQHATARPAFTGSGFGGPPIPFRRRTVLFSKAERSFYQVLRSVVPDHMIFVKVKLADLVCSKPHQSLWDYFTPINRKHIDFVVCDPTLSPVLAIELEKANHYGGASAANILEAALGATSLPVVHVPHKRRYLFNELRKLLAPYVTVPHPLL
ncbi:MAG TPA: DUF2726 domain-containing protein, partial [Chthoniobacterales bacterium]|nr:DUF2726 domain-containing protein [Chthoniobacterales bacterium]